MMVEKIQAFRALDGSLHSTWEEAAAVQGGAIFAAMLPESVTGPRNEVGAELARHFFVERNEQMLNAFVQLQELMMSAPSDSTQGMAKRLAPNVTSIDERKWFGGKR